MSGGLPTPVRSPEGDVSPKSQASSKKTDYFSLNKRTSPLSGSSSTQNSAKSTPRASLVQRAVAEPKGKGKETAESTGDASATTPGETASSAGSSGPPSRKASISSITFAPPRHPSLPQGLKKPHAGSRIRAASPPHRRLLERRVLARSHFLAETLLRPKNKNFVCYYIIGPLEDTEAAKDPIL
ncbi:hypothetical protein K445DRAFT_20182 [Daldinia sp. EC12]|nr:hypothetical protein K445DRAFT_20182 [Daldinia sp. EC12]